MLKQGVATKARGPPLEGWPRSTSCQRCARVPHDTWPLSASDLCCASAEGVADGLVGADGRFRIRSDGCSASTGAAADAADVEEMTSSGIGAFLFLNGAVESREDVLGPLPAHGGASAVDSETNRGGSAGCYSRVLPDLLRVVLVIVVIVPVVLYRLGLPVPLQNDSLELCLVY